MNEESKMVQDSAVVDETAATEKPIKPKKKYITPQMDIEYFEVEDVITTSIQEDPNQERGEVIDDNDPDNGFF